MKIDFIHLTTNPRRMLIIIFLFLFSHLAVSQAPLWQWSKQIGGVDTDYGNAVTTDAAGNVFTTGIFEGTVDFDPGAGTYNMTSAGFYDIFISKLDAAGNFVWAKSIGDANGWGESFFITVTANGDVYTTGYFLGTLDFDPGAGTFNLTSDSSTYDVFISRLNASGNFMWAKAFHGGDGDDVGKSIVVDASGNVYTTGYFTGTVDYDPSSSGIFNLASLGYYDAFISKLDSAGNFVWAKATGGIDDDEGHSITMSASGKIYVTGYFSDVVDFDPGPGTFNLTSGGNIDLFVSKLDTSGNYIWAKSAGNTDWESGNSICIGTNENIFITGYFGVTTDFDPGPGTFYLTSAAFEDIFILKLDSTGNFIMAKSMGGASSDYGFSIALDAAGNIYTYGQFWEPADFDPGPGTYILTNASSNYADLFISKLNPSGDFVWALQIGGTGNEYGESMHLDATGRIYVTGYFFSPSVSFGSTTLLNADNSGNTADLFIAKLDNLITGTESVLNDFGISVYPNPSAKLLMISILNQEALKTIRTVEISNVLGEKVYSLKKEPGTGEQIHIDVSQLTPGIYFVVVSDGNNNLVKRKIVKM